VRVLVTDGHELAGLSAARSLGRAGYPVTALLPTPCPSDRPPVVLASRYVSSIRRGSDPWHNPAAFAAEVLGLISREQLDVVLPISEAAIYALDAVRAEVPDSVKLLMPSSEQLRYTLSKYHATQAAQRLGIPTPRTAFVYDGTQGGTWDDSGLAQLRYPLILKVDNRPLPAGGYQRGRAVRVDDAQQAQAVLAELRASGGAVIAQERCPDAVPGRFCYAPKVARCCSLPTAACTRCPIPAACPRCAKATPMPQRWPWVSACLSGLDYSGVAMVEFRRAPDGELHFLEINGRLWGSLALALHAGVDFPLAMVQAALSPPDLTLDTAPAPPPPPFPPEVRCRNIFPGEVSYVKSVLTAPPSDRSRLDKLATVAEFFALSLDPRIHHDYFWAKDPLPGLLQAGISSVQLLRKLGQVPAQRRMAKERASLWRLLLKRPSGPPHDLLTQPLLFLCLGNICRSPFAAAYFNARVKALGLPLPLAHSAALLDKPGRGTPVRLVQLAQGFGLDLSEHRSKTVTSGQLRQAAAVLVMDAGNAWDLWTGHPQAFARTYPLGIYEAPRPSTALAQVPDPYDRSPAESVACYQQIARCIDGLLAKWMVARRPALIV
jgi:protein-tyrosine-phosphatase/predicted ATP-grasp superfamily ATP-dependent carboligase